MIGYLHALSFRPSLCLSLCDEVHCGVRGWYSGLNVLPSYGRTLPVTSSFTFPVGCIDNSLATKSEKAHRYQQQTFDIKCRLLFKTVNK